MSRFWLISLLLILLLSCKIDDSNSLKNDKITFLKSITLNIPEPSGLDFYDGKLWFVSDENSTIYQTDTLGNIISSFKVNGQDLEGITNDSDTTLAIILERTREIVKLNKNGNEIFRAGLKISGDLNSGLEGISFNPNNKHYFVFNEKNPRLIFELDSNFTELQRTDLEFASDFSGICFDKSRNAFWMISDESKSIFLCDLKYNVVETFRVNINQMEGVAIDTEKNILYVVSDPDNTLYIYQLK